MIELLKERKGTKFLGEIKNIRRQNFLVVVNDMIISCIIACIIYIPFCPVCVVVVELWELFDLGCGYVCEYIGAC